MHSPEAEPSLSGDLPHDGRFVTTHWSVVLAARESDSPAAQKALELLCQTYWYPLYAFVRRQGYSPEDAQDLTQAFFARVLEKCYLADVDQSKGRFRTFLMAALSHFLSDSRDRERAAKRGGGKTIIHLDALAAEERYRLEPTDTMTPDQLMDRAWALTVVRRATDHLRREYAEADKTDLFEYLRFKLSGSGEGLPYAVIASRIGKTESAIKSEALRLLGRFRHFLRSEVQDTVAGVSDIDDEIRYLIRLWSHATGTG